MDTAEKLTALCDRLAKLDAAYQRELRQIFDAEIKVIRNTPGENLIQVNDVTHHVERYSEGVGVASAMIGAMADYIYS